MNGVRIAETGSGGGSKVCVVEVSMALGVFLGVEGMVVAAGVGAVVVHAQRPTKFACTWYIFLPPLRQHWCRQYYRHFRRHFSVQTCPYTVLVSRKILTKPKTALRVSNTHPGHPRQFWWAFLAHRCARTACVHRSRCEHKEESSGLSTPSK